MAAIRALLFDFGGVFVGIHFDRVIARWAELAGVDVEVVKSRFVLGPVHDRFERGEVDEAAFYQSLRADLGLELSDAQWADGWSRVFGDEIPDTVELLRELAPRVPVYLFSNTNAPHHVLWSKRHARAVEPMLRQFMSFEIGHRKPDRESFEHIAAEIGMRPEEIMFFDDMPANVEGARAAGMQAVHVRTPEDVRRAVAPWLQGATR